MNSETEVNRLLAKLQPGFPLAIIGSTTFWHPQSSDLCTMLGQTLAAQTNLLLLTGGVSGVGEVTGRSFFQTRQQSGSATHVYHILPHGMTAWDYGETLHAGKDMAERRATLARMASIYIVVEGGPATMDEVRIALSNDALVIPVARTGGCAAEVYRQVNKPALVPGQEWNMLESEVVGNIELAQLVAKMVTTYAVAVVESGK